MADYAIHDTTLIAQANVLRKKFGTSDSQDPADYADKMNLMGLLEVKTASGAIASFADGADGVPVKSCVVSFLPSGGGGTPSAPVAITGVSGLVVTRTGKNLLNGVDAVKTANNIRFYYTSGKYYPAGTYTLSISETVSGIYIKNVSTNTNIFAKYNSNFITFTLTEKTLISYDFYKVGINQDDNIMLEVGSTATTYSPYVTPSVVTDTFGQTIYGGTRDLCTDKASVTWGYIASYNGETLTGRWVSSMDTYVAGTTPTTGAEVAYELATPTELTGLTPHEINTLLGDNNFYADTGTMSVEYRADIDLALNA